MMRIMWKELSHLLIEHSYGTLGNHLYINQLMKHSTTLIRVVGRGLQVKL
ncbi:unnamed protein product [Brassica oleracea]